MMVGARVLLGCRSLERTPSYIEVYGRKQTVKEWNENGREWEWKNEIE